VVHGFGDRWTMLDMGRQPRRTPISGVAKTAIRAIRAARSGCIAGRGHDRATVITSPEHCDQNVICRSSLGQIGNELSTGASHPSLNHMTR